MADANKDVELFADTFSKAVESLEDNKRFKKAKSEFLDRIWEEFLYDVIDQIPDRLESLVRDMANNAVKALLEGDEASLRRFLKLDGYTGRDRDHPVIHGTLFETGPIALRKQIVQAHAELIERERIKDLEDQQASLVSQVRDLSVRNGELQERLNSMFGPGETCE